MARSSVRTPRAAGRRHGGVASPHRPRAAKTGKAQGGGRRLPPRRSRSKQYYTPNVDVKGTKCGARRSACAGKPSRHLDRIWRSTRLETSPLVEAQSTPPTRRRAAAATVESPAARCAAELSLPAAPAAASRCGCHRPPPTGRPGGDGAVRRARARQVATCRPRDGGGARDRETTRAPQSKLLPVHGDRIAPRYRASVVIRRGALAAAMARLDGTRAVLRKRRFNNAVRGWSRSTPARHSGEFGGAERFLGDAFAAPDAE